MVILIKKKYTFAFISSVWPCWSCAGSLWFCTWVQTGVSFLPNQFHGSIFGVYLPLLPFLKAKLLDLLNKKKVKHSVIALAWTYFEYFLKKTNKAREKFGGWQSFKACGCGKSLHGSMKVIYIYFSPRIKFLFLMPLNPGSWITLLWCTGRLRPLRQNAVVVVPGERRELAPFLEGR